MMAAILYSSCSVNNQYLKISVKFFNDSIVKCNPFFSNRNVIFSDSIIQLSLDEVIYPHTCEICINNENILKKEKFPSQLIPTKQIKLKDKILKFNKIIKSVSNNDTILVKVKGCVELSTKEKLIEFECIKKFEYDTGIMNVYFLINNSMIRDWCVNYLVIPNSYNRY